MPKTYKWDLFVRLTHWIVAGSFLTGVVDQI
ncbi:cytochrome b, partial [Vibrio anguillarum]|nr:cytochrome b [Vibrio anguillarum]